MSDCRKNTSTILDSVQQLIARKLRHQQREQERTWTSTQQATYKNLHEEILISIRNGALGRAFVSAPLEAYREIVENAATVTKEWPETVWDITKTLLDQVQTPPPACHVINAIIDEYAWPLEQEPFTLNYVDPERLKQYVHHEAGRYGTPRNDIMTSLDRPLQVTAAAAKCAILNTARQAREGISIAIDEYVLRHQQDANPDHLTIGRDSSRQDPAEHLELANAGPRSDCLPNHPTRKDDWFNVIRDMVSDFHKENQRCPNAAEAWVRLRENPPTGYGIQSGKDRGGVEAVIMDGRTLDKDSFYRRWRRYTAPKKGQ